MTNAGRGRRQVRKARGRESRERAGCNGGRETVVSFHHGLIALDHEIVGRVRVENWFDGVW